MKTKSQPPSSGAPRARDAIAVLKQDHAEARANLRALSESSERALSKRTKILADVGPALWVHMQIEEETFYPAFEAAMRTADDEVMAFEARAEHRGAKAALARLESCDPETTEFRALATVVYDLVEHHAKEEEEEMFPRVRALLSRDHLLMLGEQLQTAKEQLIASGQFRRNEMPEELATPRARPHASA